VVTGAFLKPPDAIPQREMRLVPPVHFQVELAFPRVVSQASFRRWMLSGVLDGGEVLRQHDAAFEFKPARRQTGR
jgi:hypothetical protein